MAGKYSVFLFRAAKIMVEFLFAILSVHLRLLFAEMYW